MSLDYVIVDVRASVSHKQCGVCCGVLAPQMLQAVFSDDPLRVVGWACLHHRLSEIAEKMNIDEPALCQGPDMYRRTSEREEDLL